MFFIFRFERGFTHCTPCSSIGCCAVSATSGGGRLFSSPSPFFSSPMFLFIGSFPRLSSAGFAGGGEPSPLTYRLLAVDCAVWALFHLSAGCVTHLMPASAFKNGGGFYRLKPWERGGRFYRRVLKIHRWKRFVPDLGDIYPGGFAKRSLSQTSASYLRRFLLETRRGELTHWFSILPTPLFFLWNDWLVASSMIPCAFLIDLPLIAIQRYNRARLSMVLSLLTPHRRFDKISRDSRQGKSNT